MEETNFVVSAPFRPHAIRDGKLITGQQQDSVAAAAKRVEDEFSIDAMVEGTLAVYRSLLATADR